MANESAGRISFAALAIDIVFLAGIRLVIYIHRINSGSPAYTKEEVIQAPRGVMIA